MTAILATKLFETRAPRDLVARPRLVERLGGALEARLTLVSAPAGYGKSTLLAEWRASNGAGERVAWLSVDEADNDPVRFWSHVAAALHRASPGLGDDLADALAASVAPPVQPHLERLVNDLTALDEPLVIVLDDLHAITDPELLDSIGFLAAHLPPHVHLVVATRTDPPFPIATWRARGDVVEVRAADLRFTRDETSTYLDGCGIAIDAGSLAVLDVRTEGWAAGVRLAALALAGGEDAAAFVGGFAGDHRSVVDYLGDEVLARLPPDVVEFLLQTSVLERMCGELCDALTGRADGQTRLEALEAANLFVVALDATRTWYRYHHLFADLLRRELRARHGDAEATLHARAARWLAASGDPSAAVPHAVASGDRDLVIGLGTDHGLDFVVRGDMRALRQLYGTADEALRARPEAPLGFAWLAMLSADIDGARRWLRQADVAIDSMPDVPPGPVLDAEILRAVLADRDGDRTSTMRGVDRVLRLLDDHPEVTGIDRVARRARMLLLRAREDVWRDEPDAALAVLREIAGDVVDGAAGARRDERPARPLVELLGVRAVLRVWDGRVGDGIADAQQALDVEAEHALDGTPHGVWARLALGTHHLERLEVDDAEPHLARALELARAHTEVHCVALVVSVWSDWLRLSGLPAEALEAVRVAEDELCRAVDLAPLAVRRLARAEVLARLALGDVDAAAAVPASMAAGTATHAQLALAGGDAARAVALAEDAARAARSPCRRHELIEALAIAGVGHAATGDGAMAAACVGEALRVAAPAGWLAPFADAGRPLRPLLGRSQDADPGVARMRARVLDVLGGRRPAVVDQHGLVERLSERELAVLQRLPSSLSNQEIARLLYVSTNTLKTQLQSIYRKLGVRSRHEAIERARALGLL